MCLTDFIVIMLQMFIAVINEVSYGREYFYNANIE